MLSLRRRRTKPPPTSTQRLQPGLPGYLIPFATLAFVPQRQLSPSMPPSPLVFLPISTHFTAPLAVPHTPGILKSISFKRSASVELRHFTSDLINRLRTL